jgi:hypothetical protein
MSHYSFHKGYVWDLGLYNFDIMIKHGEQSNLTLQKIK